MKSVVALGAVLIALGVACAAWGYWQTREANDAEQAAADTRAGRSEFEKEPELKQRLIDTAERNARDFRAAATYWFIASGGMALVGAALCIAYARRRKPL